MVAGTRRVRPGALAVALGAGATVAVLAVALQTPGHRPLAAALAAGGLVLGVWVASRLPPRRADRTVMERLNDVAFLGVLAAASLLMVGVGRPFGVLVPGFVGGLVAGGPLRPQRGDGGRPRPQP